MIEKQFGALYGPALKRGDKAVIMANLRAEIDRRGGVPYGWLRIYEALLFGFYNPRTGACFPSHNALAEKAGSSVRCVRRALKTAREWGLIVWAHGLVRAGWRELRTSNRYAFAGFLTIKRAVAPPLHTSGQNDRGITTLYKSLAQIDAEVRAHRRIPTIRSGPAK
jgi:hypothetical protein